jgi:hypothetical protein
MSGLENVRSTFRVGRSVGLALVVLGAALAGCGRRPEPAPRPDAAAAPPFKAVASLKELMDSTVDPAADGFWDSVAIISTEAGVTKHEPRTDDDWMAVRRHVITLIEAMNLVMIEGRHAAPPGAKPGLGELSPEQIDQKVAANRPAFNQFAAGVRETAVQALAAVDRKDVAAVSKIGGDLDQQCESCHITFWYPNAPGPTR